MTLELRTDGPTQVVVTRRFRAAPAAVFGAHTDPALIQGWMLGPEGWTMPDCQIDARPGGSFRYDWAGPDGSGFYQTGTFLAVEPPGRILHVERMHLPDPTPDMRVETLFQDDGAGGTRLVMTMTLPDAETRAAMLATGMEHGMAASYARLDALL